MDINIDDKRSILDIVSSCKKGNDDIKAVLESLRIKDKTGMKSLTIAIIQQAVDDLESLHKRTKMFYDECASGKLTDYYKHNNSQRMLPFNREEDMTALEFFNDNKWGNNLLDSCDIGVLPAPFRAKVDYLLQMRKVYDKRCKHCLKRAAAKVTRERRNKTELGE